MKKYFIKSLVILSIVLIVFTNHSFASVAVSNDWNGYTPISSISDLNNIRDNLSGKYYLTNDIVFNSQDFANGGQFYNNGNGWIPIGSYSNSFTGVLDGNGHTITGLVINNSQSREMFDGVGLIGTNNGIVRNLGMENISVTNTSTINAQAGGIVGYNDFDGEITNCYVSGNSSIKTNAYSSYSGGIAGYSTGAISNCYNTSKVTAKSSCSLRDVATYAGGITAVNSNNKIINCYNTGSIESLSDVSGEYYARCMAGGICGGLTADSVVKNSHNTGTISTSVSGSKYAFVSKPNYAAGIVADNEGNIENCYNTGKVISTLVNPSSHRTNAAGIASNNSGTVKECYNNGIIKSVCTYETNVGGIVAYNTGSVNICCNLNEVSIEASITDGLWASLGGIVGGNKGSINNSYNTGKIIAPPRGNLMVGGIAGSNYDSANIKNCYNIVAANEVIATYHGGNPYTVGIIGINNSGCTVADCYFLDIVSKGVYIGTDTTVKCTAEQMKNKGTYSGFDFNSIWTIDSNAKYPLPTFKNHPEFPKGSISCSVHSYGTWSTISLSTCTNAGTEQRKCGMCGYIESRSTQILNHSFGKPNITKQPTCMETGIETGKCTTCGKESTNIISAAGHKLGSWADIKHATCTEKGLQETKCSVCGKKETQEISALGHDLESPIIVKEPTISSTGLMEGKCKRCEEVTKEVIPCTVKDETTGIIFEANEGVFNEGTEIKIEEVRNNDPVYETVKNVLEDISSQFTAYDITALLNGDEVILNGEITATFIIPEGYSADSELYFIGNDGTRQRIDIITSEDGKTISAKLTSLGTYAICDIDAEDTDTNVDSVGNTVKTSNNTLWIISIIASVAIVVGAIVSIILVKRKKHCNE